MRMHRSPTDWLLLGGAVIAVLAALVLTYANVAQAAGAQSGNLIPLSLGTAIAFWCAVIAVGTDLQSSVSNRLGALANTSILQCWQGWASLVGWGAFDATMLQIVLRNPVWASQTFHFDISSNLLWAGLVVGISAIIIIRSKLFKQGEVEWGAEWIYLWSAAQVLDAVNQHRIAIKRHWEGKFRSASDNIAAYANFFTDLESHMTAVLRGMPPATQAALTQEFQRLRTNYPPAGGQTADDAVNGNAAARRYIVSAVLDHVGDSTLVEWANGAGIQI
jgi:hypothetical protein